MPLSTGGTAAGATRDVGTVVAACVPPFSSPGTVPGATRGCAVKVRRRGSPDGLDGRVVRYAPPSELRSATDPMQYKIMAHVNRMHPHEPRDHVPCAGCGGSDLPCAGLSPAGEAGGRALGGVKERGRVDNEGGLEYPTLALWFMVAGVVLGLSAVRITEKT